MSFDMSFDEQPDGDIHGECLKEIHDLHALVLSMGDAIADVITQMLKGNWVDDHGHPVTNNVAMIALGNSLNGASAFAEMRSQGKEASQ